MVRVFFAFVILALELFILESNAQLVTCLGRLNPGDQLPNDIGTLCAGEDEVHIENEGLIGTIPQSIGDLSLLTRLVIQGNGFTGGMPSTIGKLQNLTLFRIVNDVGGRMPQQLWSLSKLTEISIKSQSITGSIPTMTLGLAALNTLDLADSKFTGDLPTELGQLPALSKLNVNGNFFTGNIEDLQSMLCTIDARDQVNLLPGNSFTGVITDQCMYDQNIVPTASFTAPPSSGSSTAAPVSSGFSVFASQRDLVVAVGFAIIFMKLQI